MSIFDQLGKIVTNSGAQAGPEQDHPAYLDNLKSSEAEVTQRISGLFAELGKAYYENHADNHQTEYETQLAAVREAYAEIARLQQQADEIAAHRRCPACGAQLAEGSRFCNICGVKLPEAQPAAEADAQAQRLCPKCRAELGPDDMFCTACGADLRGSGAKEEG